MSKSPAANKQAEAKLQEADQQMKEADKLCVIFIIYIFLKFTPHNYRTTKTLTRWKPDWDTAAVIYEKAGMESPPLGHNYISQTQHSYKNVLLCARLSKFNYSCFIVHISLLLFLLLFIKASRNIILQQITTRMPRLMNNPRTLSKRHLMHFIK
jgi:hypothetical protein